jgi:hypothetical protein
MDGMEATIAVHGDKTAEESLWEWLRYEDGLRGRVKARPLPPLQGALGVSTELVVALASSGTVSVLTLSLSTWLIARERQRGKRSRWSSRSAGTRSR